MFRFTRKMVYAVEAVLHVGIHGTQAPVQSREITGTQNIPERYLEQALQRLVRVGILRGVRGPRGGYRLGRPAGRITVGEIVGVIRAMEAGEEEAVVASESPLGQEIVAPVFEALDAEMMERLDRITVADLVDRAQDKNLGAEKKPAGVYETA